MTDKIETLQKLILTNKAAVAALTASMEEKEDALTEAGITNAARIVRDRAAFAEISAKIGELEDYQKAGLVEKAEYEEKIGPLRAELEALENSVSAADEQWRRRCARYDSDRSIINQEFMTLQKKIERFEAKLLEVAASAPAAEPAAPAPPS